MGPWLIPLATTAISTLGNWALNKYGGSKGGKGDSFSGTPEKYKQLKTATPQQEKFTKNLYASGGGLQQNPLYQQGQDYLSSILSNQPGAFEQFEAPYMQNFNERIVPAILERFAGLGTGAGGLNSSALQQTIAHAGRGLQSDLAQMRAGLQGQAAQQGLGYAQQPISNLLQGLNFRPYENVYTARQPGMADSLAGLLPSVAQAGLQGYFNSQNQAQSNYDNSLSRLNNMSQSVYNA